MVCIVERGGLLELGVVFLLLLKRVLLIGRAADLDQSRHRRIREDIYYLHGGGWRWLSVGSSVQCHLQRFSVEQLAFQHF